MRVLTLVRVSTDRQDVQRQRDALAAWCRTAGAETLPEVAANGVSGRPKATRGAPRAALAYYAALCAGDWPRLERHDLCQVLQLAEAGQVDAVAVYSLDRLSRDCVELLLLQRVLDALAVRLVTVAEGAILDTSRASGKMTYRIMAALAEMECDQISERTASALHSLAASGKRIGGPPLGWRKHPDTGAWYLDQEILDLCRRMRAARAEGKTYRELGALFDLPPSCVRAYLTTDLTREPGPRTSACAAAPSVGACHGR